MSRDAPTPASSSTPADAVLSRVAFVLVPLVRLLLRRGVDHPRLSAALKRVFVDEALRECARSGQPATHTAVSLLSGLQRRDVKALREAAPLALPPKAMSPTLPMQIVARWTTDLHFMTPEETPLVLPMRAADPAAPSFEALADLVSKDVHAPALLDELVRLGLADSHDGQARLVSESFVAPPGSEQLLGALARNTRDHLEAAVANVLSADPQFLEYSLVVDELRPESAQALHDLARKLWRNAYRRTVVAATEKVAQDKATGLADSNETRVRFGVYFYAEPVRAAGAPPEPTAATSKGTPL